MKKNIFIVVMIVTTFFIGLIGINSKIELDNYNESRGVFFSYIENKEYFYGKNEKEIRKEIIEIIKISKENNINRIYLQVRAFSDSIYESNIFPYSHILTDSSKQEEEVSVDILKCFIEECRKNSIEIFAWINPYRISNGTDTSFLSENNKAYEWLNTNKVKIIENKGIFYNPAEDEVIDLIIDGVEEIVKDYDIDGILLDDYFYPDNTIDLINYEAVEDVMSIEEFRLNNTNKLISGLYKAVKKINPNVSFGISPDGNIDNNYDKHYADIKTWLTEDGYIDYIMPQIYYGFLHETKPFIQTYNEWSNLIKNDTELLVALALYKSGEEDVYAKSGRSEWLKNSDIIKKQIEISRKNANYCGFSLFRYDFIKSVNKSVNLEQELNNYNSLF